MPARGGATVLRPGRNLANRSERAPCLEKTPSVRRTQESGSMEILQRSWRTLIPLRRPSRYQRESAARAAVRTRRSEAGRFRRLVPARAPAARRSGMEGRGRPTCSAKTQTSKTAYPWWRRNSRVRCILRGRALRVRSFGNERSSMPPAARHDKFAEGLACAGSQLLFTKRVRQGRRVTRIADGHGRDRFAAGRDGKHLARFLRIEAGHLMNDKTASRGLNAE